MKFLTLVLVCLMLTAFTLTPIPSSSASAELEDQMVGYTLPIVTEPLTLTFLTREFSDGGASFNADVQPLIWQEYEKATGIHIKFDALPDAELKETVQLRLAANQDIPDMIIIPGTQDGSYLSRYLNDGVVIPLNDHLAKYGQNFQKIVEQYPDYYNNSLLPDGSYVGVGPINASQYGFRAQLIRQDWLDLLGLDMPTTPDELLDVALAFMENDMNGNGEKDEIGMTFYGDQLMELGHAWGLHFVTGAGWTTIDGKVTYEPVTEPYREYLKYLNKCVETGVLPADWLTVDKATSLARVSNGLVGIQLREPAMSAISRQDPNDSMKKTIPDADWRVIPPLDGPYGKGILIKEPIASIWRTLVVTSANKHPEETVKWIDYVCFSEEGSRLMNFGIEGETYDLVDGKIVVKNSPLSGNKVLDDGTWLGYGDYLPVLRANDLDETSFAHLNLPADNPGLQSVLACFPYVQEPFVPPIPTVEQGSQISALMADISTYVAESRAKFISGDLNLESDFDKYVNDLESIGLTTVIQIYQERYDALH